MSFVERMRSKGGTGRFKTGLKYVRRSFRFQLRHPVVIILGFLQLVVAWGALFGIVGYVLSTGLDELSPIAIVGVVVGYLVMSTLTTITNAVITGYVFAAEMGVSRPLSHALSHVYRRLPTLLGYALLSATVLSALRLGIELLRQRAIVGRLAAWLIEATVLTSWYAATIYAVPVLLFEEGTSLRRMIPRSASLLAESRWTCATAISAWPVTLAFGAAGISMMLYIGGATGLIAFVFAILTGLIIQRIFNSIFKAYLYGEIAGPFSLSNT